MGLSSALDPLVTHVGRVPAGPAGGCLAWLISRNCKPYSSWAGPTVRLCRPSRPISDTPCPDGAFSWPYTVLANARRSNLRKNCPWTRHRRSEGHTSELQSLMRISYAVFCLKKKKNSNKIYQKRQQQQKRHKTFNNE